MASGAEELLEVLYDLIREAKNVPLSGDKCMVDRDKALDLIEDIRSQFPVELSEAKKIVDTKNDIIASAKRENEIIRKQAESEAKRLLDTDTIHLQARQRANEMVQAAETRCRELKQSANTYCDDALRRTEEAIVAVHDEITKSRAGFRAVANSTAAPQNNARSAIYDAAADED